MCLYLVSAALAGLQAGQDLALYSGHPGVPVLQALGLKVPRLPGERHHDKVCVLFLCKKKKKNGKRNKLESDLHVQQRQQIHRGLIQWVL